LSTKLSNELQYRKEIAVVYQTDTDLILKTSLPDKLVTRLRGTGWDLFFLKSFSAQNPFIYDIPRNAKFIGESDLINQLNQYLDNQNILVEDLGFSNRSITMEKKLVKKVPVKFDGDLTFAAFYKLYETVWFNPDSIEVIGPETEVSKINFYPCAYQKIDNIQKDLVKKVELKSPEHDFITLSPQVVEMNINTEQLTQKTIKVPVRIANSGIQGINIVPGDIEISFLIGLSEFPYISADDFSAQIIIPADRIPNQQFAVSIVKKPVNAVIQEIRPAFVDAFFDH
jgi:hypothetical protein